MEPVEPIEDTWTSKKYAGCWSVKPAGFEAPSSEAANRWFAAQLRGSFDGLSHLARPWRVELRTSSGADTTIERREGEASILDRVEAEIARLTEPLHSIDCALDVSAYVRIAPGAAPIRAWIRRASELTIWGGPNASASLTLDHTLFCPRSPDGDDNAEFYALNAPILESALRAWERRIGPIREVEGLEGIGRYGFSI